MGDRKISPVYRLIKWLVWVFYPRMEVVGAENLPEEGAVIVGNHTQMNGPIACELYFPVKRYTWCAAEMMRLREVPGYAFQDFWSDKPRYIRWFYRLLSYIIAPLSVCVFNNADTIAVYKDARLVSTFRESMDRLREGASVVVFPEHDEPHDHIICDFQDKFIDIAKLYHKKTGTELSFVPLYIAPRLKKMYLGKPIRYCAANPIKQERRRICEYLMDEVSGMARALPEHIVVPYKNIPKKHYNTNLPKERTANEKAGR